MIVARSLLALAAAAAAAGIAQAHTFDKLMQTKTVKAKSDFIQIPPAGGTRPVGYFGAAQGTIEAGTPVTFKADASLSGGMFIKGTLLNNAQFQTFAAACTQPGDKAVSVYDWGAGSCDDWMNMAKNSNYPTFTAQVNTKPDGSGAALEQTVTLPAQSQGLYVIWENLMGMPVTFTRTQLTTPAGAIAGAGAPIDFPPATVYMSAALVYAGDHAIVDTANVSFAVKGTAPNAAAKPSAVMGLSADDMEPGRLGCTLGFYFGWFKNNVAGRDVCKGAEFETEIVGDILTIKGTIRAVAPEVAATELAGPIQMTASAAYFQGDATYTFDVAPHGTEGFYVLVPNRLDTPLTVQKLSVTARYANLVGLFSSSPREALESGPVAGIVITVLLATFALVYLGYRFGRCRGAAAVGRPKDSAMV